MEDPHFKGTRDRNVRRWERGDSAERTETLAVEEPLEIRLGGRRFTLTMRTPGNDEELVAGFLFAEGFIENSAEIDEIRRVPGGDGMPEDNIVDVILRVPVDSLRERLRRNFAMTSSCGLCGKTSIESIARRIPPPVDAASIAASTLAGFAQSLAPAQPLFARTGGVHAAALFDLACRCATPLSSSAGGSASKSFRRPPSRLFQLWPPSPLLHRWPWNWPRKPAPRWSDSCATVRSTSTPIRNGFCRGSCSPSAHLSGAERGR